MVILAVVFKKNIKGAVSLCFLNNNVGREKISYLK